jgi:hypothetical protein
MASFKHSSSSTGSVADHKSKKAKHNHEKVKVESGKKVNMIQSTVSAMEASALSPSSQPVSLSKSVMGMKFMQRQSVTTNAAVSNTKVNQKQGATSGDTWFRTDHFVSEYNESTETAPSSSSSNIRNNSLLVFDSNGKSREIKVMSGRDEVDVYARLPGRRSFNGCNRTVERNYQQIIDSKYIEKQNVKDERKAQKDIESGNLITDEDMAERYEELISLPRGPNQGKRANPPTKNEDYKKKHKSKR